MPFNPNQVFLVLVNRSLAATYLVVAVLILRFLLLRMPKWTHCMLWALVALRLVFSLSIPSPLSAFNLIDTPVNENGVIEYAEYTGEGVKPSAVFERPTLAVSTGAEGVGPSVTLGTEREHVYLPYFSHLWLFGAAAMLGYALVSWLRLRRRVAASVEQGGVWLCDEIGSPFILGVLAPRIYVPSSLTEPQFSHVLAHERAHLARHDHWWKPLGFALLAIYWFNPALWLAYILLCRDIELACDERVYRDMALDARADYSQTLLEQSRPGGVAACPLAFGEVGVRERVRAALGYRKPAFWAIAVAIVACAAAAVCFLTNPAAKQDRYAEYRAAVENTAAIRYAPPAYSSTAYPVPVTDPELLAEVKAALAQVGKANGMPSQLDDMEYLFTGSFTLDDAYARRYYVAEGYLCMSDETRGETVVLGRAPDDLMVVIEAAARREMVREESVSVRVWADHYGEDAAWADELTMTLPELPGVTFTCTCAEIRIEGVPGDGAKLSYSIPGMPVWNAYFADLTGDGVPELCATVGFGSGIVDEHIVVFDAVSWKPYALWDRGEYDYALSAERGKLIVMRYDHKSTAEEMGTLLLVGGRLEFVPA